MATPYALRKFSPHTVQFLIANLQTISDIRKFMEKIIRFLQFRSRCNSIARQAISEFIPPDSERLELLLPLKIEPRRTSAMGRLRQEVRKAMGSCYPRHSGESLLHIAGQASPTFRALFAEIDSLKSSRLPPSKTMTEHRRLSESEESYSMTSYHRKRLQDQLELRLSLSPSGLRIVADVPRHLWLLLYLRGNSRLFLP